jgi:predicted nucleic acid-binding protein
VAVSDAPGSLALVLDTNVLVSDWLLESPAGTHIRNQSLYGPITLIVPELVVREVVRVYRRKLKGAQRELRNAIVLRRKLQAGAPDPALDQVVTDVNVDAAAGEYESRLRQKLEQAKARLVPLPDVSHDRLVHDALRGRKPFDQEGQKGYRDALIWHSVLGIASSFSRVILVSANHNDFGSRQASEQLAKDLVEDLTALGQDGAAVADVGLRRDLASVIEHDLPAEHGVVMDLRERLRHEHTFFTAVYGQLNDVNNQLYADIDLDPDLGVEWEDLDLDFVNDLHDFEVVGVTAGRSGAPSFVRIIAHADVQYRIEVSAWDFLDEREETLPRDIDWNERTGKGTLVDVLPAELEYEALYVPGDDKLAEVELKMIREEWDWVTEGRMLGGPVEPPRPPA